jgi:hypothetical protein
MLLGVRQTQATFLQHHIGQGRLVQHSYRQSGREFVWSSPERKRRKPSRSTRNAMETSELPRTSCSAHDPLHAYLRLNLCRSPPIAIMMGKYPQDRAEFREKRRVFDNQERVFAVLADKQEQHPKQQKCALSRLCDRCMRYWRSSHRRESTMILVLANFSWLLVDRFTRP